jgi:glycosyltransferase involved in cell wall biosynthesis
MRLTTTLLTPGWGVKRALSRDREAAHVLSKADLVEIQWSQMLPTMKVIGTYRKPVVGFVHDIISDSARGRICRAQSRWEQCLAAARWPAYRFAEPRFLKKCAGVLTFSERDLTTLIRQGVRTPVRTVAPWIDQVASPPGPASAPVVLMVGDFGRQENSDGALWFLRNCWPGVRAAVSGAQLVFAGRRPPADLHGESVTATGWVDDLDPWYRGAAVVIAPLLSGAGLKFKVAQAMAYGLPVVGTPVAADGYREANGQDAFAGITKEPDAFVNIVVRCLKDPAWGQTVGSRAAAWADQAFNWERSVDETLKWYRILAEVQE